MPIWLLPGLIGAGGGLVFSNVDKWLEPPQRSSGLGGIDKLLLLGAAGLVVFYLVYKK